MTGDQSEGPATGTTQGDQSEGPATGTGQGDQSQKPRCCRRLQFDDEPAAEPGLEDNLRNGFQEELRRSRDAARLRWNFDFEREEPLPGNWAWEKVGGPVPPARSQEDGQPPQEESEEPEEPEEPLPGNWAWEKVGGPVPPARAQEDGQPPQEEPEEPGGGA